jgi:hypothetical protein
MAKRNRNPKIINEPDSVYFLKLLMFFLLGAFWVRINVSNDGVLSLPFGFLVGLIFARHDHFNIDRKIEYAILLIALALSAYIPIVGFWI